MNLVEIEKHLNNSLSLINNVSTEIQNILDQLNIHAQPEVANNVGSLGLEPPYSNDQASKENVAGAVPPISPATPAVKKEKKKKVNSTVLVTDKPVTVDMLREATQIICEKKGLQVAKELLAKYNAKRVADLMERSVLERQQYLNECLIGEI